MADIKVGIQSSEEGPRGHRGPTGPTGPSGSGATGPTGPGSSGLLPTASQIVYVNKGGSDLTGNGTSSNPFLTIQRALTSITDASATKRYAVLVGPGEYADPFQIKPWTAVVGIPAGANGVTPNGSTIVEITAAADTCGFDASFGTFGGLAVGWYAQLGFANHQTWTQPAGSQPQLNFQSCSFDAGADYDGPGTVGFDNVLWADCLSYGGANVTGWKFLWLQRCIFLGGTITATAGPAGALESTTLLAQDSSIGAALSPTNVVIKWAPPSPVGAPAVGDFSGSAIVGTLTLDGASTSFSATVGGIPPAVVLNNSAPAPVTQTGSNSLGYAPAPGIWVAPPPTTVQQALDRIAAVLNMHFGMIP